LPQALQLQVTATGRTIMVDASPTMSAARLSRVIEKRTGVPQGCFALYYGSRPIYGTLAESGVASGSTIELKFRGRGGGLEPQATNSLEVEIEPKPASMERSGSVATNVMRSYDTDGDGKFSQDEVHAMAADFIKEKKTRRLATKAAIAMGVIILLVVALNAGLTAAIVFLSKDVKVVGGKLTDPTTGKPLQVDSASTTVASDGTLRDRTSNRAIATASALQELAIDSRLPDSAWDELKYIDVRNDNGGSVHLFVQAFTRIPSTYALHGSFVKIHSTIGTITLDGDLMTFSDNLSTEAFANAQFAVTSSGRRLVGIIYLIGFFNQIPSFDAWNTTFDTPPLIPSTFYANASLLYACTYGSSNLCENTDVPAEAITMLDDKLWAVSRVEMWADLNAGVGKEVYWFMAGNPGWTLERHLDLNAKTEHVMQTWQGGSNESYFCRTILQPESLSTWLSPLSAASARASYKGEVDGTTYGALQGELLHHFQIKPLEAEHISLDFYSHLVGPNVIPAFVQLRIGSDLGDEDARFIAYKFDSFQPLQSLPPAGTIFNQSVSPDPFNVTHCNDTLAYTDQDQEGTKIHSDNKITSTDPLATPLSRTALTYVLGAHPTWKASEIVAWEDQLSNNYTEYIMYQNYIDPEPEMQAIISGTDNGTFEEYNGTFDAHNGTHSRRLGHLSSQPCPKPGGWCTHSGSSNSATTCSGRSGHFCSDIWGGSGFFPCDGGSHTWPYGKCQQGCVNAKSQACPSAHMISSGGFPFSLSDPEPSSSEKRQAYAAKQKKKKEAIFPCDVSIGYPIACKGAISCSTPDVPLCGGACGGLVTGSVSGGGEWDCSADLSSCTGKLFISGGVKVGIPNCKWCPSALEFTVEFARHLGVQACCAGPFAYTKDTITLKATFLIVLRAEMSGTFYEMATKDDNACKTARPNWIQNGLRKMVIAGKVEICIGFCFPIISGDLFMVPEVALPVTQRLKQRGQCCLLVSALISRDSCDHCPSGDRYQMTPYWVPPYPEATGRWSWMGPWYARAYLPEFRTVPGRNVWGCWSSRKCS